jgi:hypothetical protein
MRDAVGAGLFALVLVALVVLIVGLTWLNG